jgi:hypothetical protein
MDNVQNWDSYISFEDFLHRFADTHAKCLWNCYSQIKRVSITLSPPEELTERRNLYFYFLSAICLEIKRELFLGLFNVSL